MNCTSKSFFKKTIGCSFWLRWLCDVWDYIKSVC